MAVRCGIVGLPNVGKSTLFNALTNAEIAAENYPFCTIEPNSGIVPVPDARLDALAALVKPERVVPATVEFVDIAGLVAGASRGEGLGNQFLAHIRETHAVAHVVRCFEDENVTHVDGDVDPLRDLATIETELALADLETVAKRLDRATRTAKSGDEQARAEVRCFEALQQHLSDGHPARSFEVPEACADAFRECFLLTAKPVLYVANVDEEAIADGNAHTRVLEEHAQKAGAGSLRVCGKLEAELVALAPEERAAFLEDLGLREPGLHRLVREAYRLLELVTFLTAGPQEVRAWTVRSGANAAQAAGTIHTDFERNFIRAEVIRYEDYTEAGGENEAKGKGLMRLEGRDYGVQDGDVIFFRVGAS